MLSHVSGDLTRQGIAGGGRCPGCNRLVWGGCLGGDREGRVGLRGTRYM